MAKPLAAAELVLVRVGMTISDAEKLLIAATLKYTDDSISAAALLLGIDRSTLYSKIRRYGIRRVPKVPAHRHSLP